MIQPIFLNNVANFIHGRVAKVVINGTYEVSNFTVKHVTDNVLALNYLVPVQEVSLISLIELKDINDNLISANSVNVPITADHLMLQSITVKGGL